MNKLFTTARHAAKWPFALGLVAVMLFSAVTPAYAADVQIVSVSVGGPSGTVTYGTPGSVSYTVTVVCGGKGNAANFPLTISSALPTGVGASFSPSQLYFPNGCGTEPFSQTSTLTLTTTAATPGGVSSFSASAGGQTGGGSLTVQGIQLSVTGFGAFNKEYDGGTIATPDLSGVKLSSGVISPDIVKLGTTGVSASFDTEFVGEYKLVTAAGFFLWGDQASNYTLVQPEAHANITKRALHITISSVNSKDYDGSDAAVVTLATDKVLGDNVSATGTGTFNNKHAGLNKTVTVSSVLLSGADQGNYYVDTTEATAQANIYQRALTVTAAPDSKPYDGTNGSSVKPTITSGALQGTDTAGFNQTFDTKNVGTGKTLTPSGVVNDGNAGADYTYSFVTNSNGVVTPASLTVGAVGVNKVYDGLPAASVSLTDNRAFGDFILTHYTAAVFANENVGTGKAVSVSGISIDGTDAGNYVLSNTSASTTADITPLAITVSAMPNTKYYDGNLSALTAPVITTGTPASGDVANFTEAYTDKDAGSGKTLVVSGAMIDGNSGNNYDVTLADSTSGVINRKPISSVIADNKTISDADPLPPFTFHYGAGDLVSGEAASVIDTAPVCGVAVVDPGVGSYPITCSGGADSNYDFSATNYVAGTLTVSAAGVPHVGVSPQPLNLGYQLIGTTGIAQALTITNNATGPVALNISSITVSGAPFSLVTTGSTCYNGTTWAKSLAQGASCKVYVSFSPTVAGNPNGYVRIISNDPAASTFDAVVTGNGSAGVQILFNRSFENDVNADNLPDRWGKRGVWSIDDGRDCTVHYNGRCSQRFVANGQLNIIQQSRTLAGKKGSGITFFLWSKADSVPTKAQYNVRVLLYNGTTLVGSKILNFPKGTHGFKRVLATFTAPADYTRIVFRITFKATSGTVWFDLGALKK